MRILATWSRTKSFLCFLVDTYVVRRIWTLSAERIRIYQLLSKPRWTRGEVSILGHKIRYSDAASCFSAWSLIFDDKCYDFDNALPRQPIIVDLGANIGIASLYFCTRFPQARILAYEPDPSVFPILQSNLAQFPNVTLHQMAIAGNDGSTFFHSSGDDAGTILDENKEGRVTTEVQCASLRSVLEPLDYVDLLKIDVEGAELGALRSASKTLSAVHRIFIEYHSYVSKGQRLDELLHIISNAGFRYFLQSETIVKSPFAHRMNDNGMDGRINIYATRTDQSQ